MELLSVLIALAFDQANRHHRDRRLLATFAERICGRWALLGLIVFVSLVSVCNYLLRNISPLLAGLFGVVVLVFCLGMGELLVKLRDFAYMRERDDEEGARHAASALAGREVCSSGARLTREMMAVVLVEGHARGFGILFWYLVFGPAGALFAGLVRHIALPSCQAVMKRMSFAATLYWWLDWIPARISALSYGLAGSLTHAIGNWQVRAGEWDTPNTAVLIASGTGALLLETEEQTDLLSRASLEEQEAVVQNARDLVMRALTIWITIVALITLGGWLK